MRKIPSHIVDEAQRRKLVEIGEHLKTLEQAHRELVGKAQKGTLTEEESGLLQKIIAAHENLDKTWKALAPSLAEVLATLQKT